MSGLNLRKRPRVCYYEPEEPPFDEYVYCAECGDYVYEYCAIHGPLLVIPDDKVVGAPPAGVPRAALTVPRVFLHLATSTIPGAGIGVFSSLALPSGVRFGPYRGARRSAAGDSDYGWQIFDKNHKPSHIVDAADDNRSNWMRYVNCARHCTEQNLVAYQYQGQLYYRTVKVIPRFSELLVFYGSQFARALGVDLRAYRAPCGCPYCQGNDQKTAPTKANKLQTKEEEKPNEQKNLKVSPAEMIQETSMPPQATLQSSVAIPTHRKKTKKSTFKRVTKKNTIEKVQNTLIEQDNLRYDTEALTAFSTEETITNATSVHSRANLPKKLTIPSFKSKNNAVKTSERSEKDLSTLTRSEVNLQKDTNIITESNYNTNKTDLIDNQTTFKCHKCHKNFDIKSDLEKHLHTHALIESNKTINKGIVCKSCRNTFNTKLLLIEHRRNQHRIQYFACTECDYATEKRESLLLHQKTHISKKPFKCDLCNYACIRKSHLLSHHATHTGEKPFKCDLCNYACIQKSDLLRHHATHTGEKPFKCDLCNYACIQKSNLLTHQRTHTSEKPFKCDLCNYACIQKSDLLRHHATHTGEKPFKCDLCNYACIQKSNLLTHQRTHTSEKPFKCDLCNYACIRKSDLLTHHRTHTGEKPFKCDLCNYACIQKSALLRHHATHTGEKPFKCDICDYRAAHTNSLMVHLMSTHSGKKPFSCDVCSYKCAIKSKLKKHLKKHK